MPRALAAACFVALFPALAGASAPPLPRTYEGPEAPPEAPVVEPDVVMPEPEEEPSPPPPPPSPSPSPPPPPPPPPPSEEPSPPPEDAPSPLVEDAPAAEDDAAFEFEVVDLTEDEEALAKELDVDATEAIPVEDAGETVVVETEMNKESEGARLVQRKNAAGARDSMSRDEISKSGGGATTTVAKRIVGVSVVGGRYVFVRGLGHRYVNTLLDGARVPSPEPELRTVPLDIFPSSALSAIDVQKTFTPDVPGDWAGGSVQLETREVPDSFMYEIGASTGYNTATTFRRMLTNGAFPGADAFAFGNVPRALPEEIPDDRRASRGELDDDFVPIYTPEQIERFGDAMYTDTRIRRGASAPPSFAIKGAIGHGFRPGEDSKLGFLAAASYGNEHQTIRWSRPIRQFSVPGGQINADDPNVSYRGMQTTYTVSWSTIGLVKYDIDAHNRLSLTGFYSREADDETRHLEGSAQNVSGPGRVVNTRIRYIMRSIMVSRLGGRHEIPRAKGLTIDWFGSYAQARRDDPAIRSMFFTDTGAGYRLDRGNEGGKQTFLDLVDHTESGALNLTMPFEQWGHLASKVKIGAWVEGKQREFLTRRFQFQVDPALNDRVPLGTGNIINDATTGNGQGSGIFYLQENTRPTDNYRARQEVYAGYALLELPFVRWFRVAGGARLEASHIAVETFDPFADRQGDLDANANGSVELDDLDVLPSLGLVFSPTAKQNVRLVGAQTLARPEFRELAPFTFTDFVGGADVQGNTELVSTKIWNADLRWEWFPSSAEVLAVSLFYKYFDEPIERVQLPRIPQLQSFRNAEGAHNAGVELEARKNLEFVWRKLHDFSIGANFTYTFSRVQLRARCNAAQGNDCLGDTLADVSTSRVRPLQDQSPYVVNTYLDYDNERSGTEIRILYNVEGPRIAEVGGLGLPDKYYQPVHNLDLVLGQRLYEGLRLELSGQNLTNAPIYWTQSGEFTEYYRRGITFTIGLSWSYERARADDE